MNNDLNSLLSGGNAPYLDLLYEQYLNDHTAVAADWVEFFRNLPDAEQLKSNGSLIGAQLNGGQAGLKTPTNSAPNSADTEKNFKQNVSDSLRAIALIRAYRVRGHFMTDLDPLHITPPGTHPELEPKHYGFTEADYDRPIELIQTLGFERATLRQVIDKLRRVYCGTIGVEFMHIQDPDQKSWIQNRVEDDNFHRMCTDAASKNAIYDGLVTAEVFEQFFDRKFTGAKRFGLEGGESLIPAFEQILRTGSKLGLTEVVIGMPHRGRLNVLHNIMDVSIQKLVAEFQGMGANPENVEGSGDVKYHLGTSADREYDGHNIHLSLTANPSHLEAVDPVVVGKVRAKQRQTKDHDRTKIMSLMLHGDAAFCGQGLVAETLALAELRGYGTGGTLHFIVNNQIGFTTAPAYSRFTPYPSDVAKAVQAPIFHVNGDDPEAVLRVAALATEFRMKFHRDVVIDMFCYRRHGHNETDEPSFTQPIMYRAIDKQATTREIYGQKLVAEGLATPEDLQKKLAARLDFYEQEFVAAASFKVNKADWLEGAWTGLGTATTSDDRMGRTAIDEETFRRVGLKLCEVPNDFNLNNKIKRQLDAKRASIEAGEGIDWATAEALAFGSLLLDGNTVRMSGQDVTRGTFSHRHAVWVDQNTEKRHTPLHHLADSQAMFEIIDSPLAEASVLGFEYGYSLADPHALVIWEGQFGDFANGAQVIIDQFIASGESKWLRMSGLVMLLPHGSEGQGPEHSSARPERYLQLCAEDNMQVVNCTTAANYFHALRRQVKRSFRKPLIVMSPKSLLRAKHVSSGIAEFTNGSQFQRIFPETAKDLAANDQIERVILCTGKVYYDLIDHRAAQKINNVVVIRLEEIYPFADDLLAAEIRRYPNAEIIWCQEEPQNQGYWHFVADRIRHVLRDCNHAKRDLDYVGRVAAAAPATGLLKRHVREQQELVAAAFVF
ncbi:MAG: 2-oxoglutarate dehydrogenase E1 component [Alphaproteobacteria bacterium]|nr:2-oxoglutarate dehydrogenase E1 component [Alphaproteobacteria bacterium]